MKTVGCLFWVGFALTGCLKSSEPAVCPETPEAGIGIALGDRVVARWQAGFWEGTVIKIQGKLLTVGWDVPPPPSSYVPRGLVAKKSAEKLEANVGDWILCLDDGWLLCRLDGTAGDRYQVTLSDDGSTAELDILSVAPMPEDLRIWAKGAGEKTLVATALAEQINPEAPANAGAEVDDGQLVLARWTDGNWYVGKVMENRNQTKESITVAWPDGSDPLEIPTSDVAPIPEEPQTLTAGDLAFCKAETSSRWWRARIDQVEGDRIKITFRDGSAGEVGASECLLAK